MEPQATVIGPADGELLELGGIRRPLHAQTASETGGGFSMVEHPLAPRVLAAPMHRHKNEDEYSFVLRAGWARKLGDEVVVGEAGRADREARGQWHTFWNAGDEPARLLEIISPAGFERYFAGLGEVLSAGCRPDPERMRRA